MPRTTLNMDTPVLRQLKKIKKQKGGSLGRIASDLLAAAIAAEEAGEKAFGDLRWVSRPMGARVDLRDKEAVRAALESEWPISEAAESNAGGSGDREPRGSGDREVPR